MAEHAGELADQITGGVEFGAAGGDLRERVAVAVGEVAGGVRIQLATCFALGAGSAAETAVSRRSWAVSRRKVRRLPW